MREMCQRVYPVAAPISWFVAVVREDVFQNGVMAGRKRGGSRVVTCSASVESVMSVVREFYPRTLDFFQIRLKLQWCRWGMRE